MKRTVGLTTVFSFTNAAKKAGSDQCSCGFGDFQKSVFLEGLKKTIFLHKKKGFF